MDKAESESVRRGREKNCQEDWWETDQERACWIATTSAVKLEHRSPAGKEKEKLEEHEEQLMKTPEPPGPSFPMTEPSVQMVRSDGGREERWPLANVERRRGGSEREQGRLSERDTEKEG